MNSYTLCFWSKGPLGIELSHDCTPQDTMAPHSTVLSDYYAAMNAHDVEKALTYLHPEVLVTFPEQERTWQGVALAHEKFSGMFEKMPSFTGSFEVLSQTSDGGEGAEVVTVACRFQCVASQADYARNMTYHIQHNLITQIHHL